MNPYSVWVIGLLIAGWVLFLIAGLTGQSRFIPWGLLAWITVSLSANINALTN
jgi:hypothetical protein